MYKAHKHVVIYIKYLKVRVFFVRLPEYAE